VTQTTGRDPERFRLPSLQVEDVGNTGAAATPAGPADRLVAFLARPWVAEILATVMAALVFSWQVNRPSPWWDEAITRDVTARTSSEIIDLTSHVDLVHASYYLLIHALLGGSASVTPIRLLSVLAAALTAGTLVRLGRELGSGRVGLLAGVLWTAAPLATRYAQEARPYAMVALMATVATLALVRVCRRPWLPLRWMIYLGALVILGLLNVIALLILVVHLSYVLATSSLVVRRRWYLAAGITLAALSPLLIYSSRQSAQVAWLPRPDLHQLTAFLLAEYAGGFAVLAVLLIAIVGLSRGTHSPSLGLGLSWALLPPVTLWLISQAHPLFESRYVFFTVPGTALAMASLAPLFRARWLTAVVLVVAVSGLSMQQEYRGTSGHGEDIRAAAAAIAERAQPGDAVLFLPASRRVVERGYPDAFRGVDDVALDRSAEQSATLWGTEIPADQLAAALRKRNRVWVVTGAERFGEKDSADDADREKERLLYNGYRLAGVTFTTMYEVRLYVHDPLPSVVASGTSS